MNRTNRVRRIAQRLGAGRVVSVGPVEHTPLGLIGLTDRIRRLRSTGPGGTGRPADPLATVPRIVKFKMETWKVLAEVASAEARKSGRRISPAQVASMLVEHGLEEVHRRRRKAE